MANYMCTIRTNYFRVTDEARYEELLSNLVSEDNINDFTKEKDGVLYHGFGSYGSIEYMDEDDECNFSKFLEEMQKILPEDEAFIFLEVGNEKLRYVTGCAIVVTSKKMISEDINYWAVNKAKELLGEDFETETEY